MAQETKAVHSGGIGLGGLLTVLFIGLKLANVIQWSWLWVLAPLWIPVAIGVGLILIVQLMLLVKKYLNRRGLSGRINKRIS